MNTPTGQRRGFRVEERFFTLLLLITIGLLAYLSTQYRYQADWTASGRHSLSKTTLDLLASLDSPVDITAYARPDKKRGARRAVEELIGRYQRARSDVTLTFVDPDRRPDALRQWGITNDGELVVHYRGRHENVRFPTEKELTLALHRLARGAQHAVYFLTGHGERRYEGGANHDLGTWAGQLAAQGFRFKELNLTQTPAIPEDSALLVLAGPQVPPLPGELERIGRYIDRGGGFLWLADPDPPEGFAPLAAHLGIDLAPGVVIDPTASALGVPQPDFTLITAYPGHPVTAGLGSATLFPQATGIELREGAPWQAEPLLITSRQSWLATGSVAPGARYDAHHDRPGPLLLGLALSRVMRGVDPPRTQRVAVIGDGDFLSNTYLGNGGNRELGDRLLDWLTGDDALIAIPRAAAVDTNLRFTPLLYALLGTVFLFVLPPGLLLTGFLVSRKRRRR